MKITSEELKEYEEGVRLKLLGEIEKFVEENKLKTEIQGRDMGLQDEEERFAYNSALSDVREFISKMK